MKEQIPSLHIVKSKSQVAAFLHPERVRILSFVSKEKMTISQVAKALGVHPANITHHFKKLEAARLIKLVEKRDNGRNLEKYYRAVAQRFDVAPPPGEVKNANAKVLQFLRDDLSMALGDVAADDNEGALGLIRTAKISGKDFARFCNKLKGLIQEFEPSEDGPTKPYTLNVSLYRCSVDLNSVASINITKKKKDDL